MQEKYGEKIKQLYHRFVDLEKTFDKVPRTAIRWALSRRCSRKRGNLAEGFI
jgi:hypothetical protein